MGILKQYSPDKVAVILGTVVAQGLAEGEFVTVEFTEDKRSMLVSTDGTGRHQKSLNQSGTVTLRLMDFSPTNDAIMTIDATDLPFAIQIVDKTTAAGMFFAHSCMLKKVPNFVKGKEGVENEYVFNFTKGKAVHSGAQEY